MPSDRLTFDASLADWKLVFRCLHAHLAEHLALMDADVLSAMQTRLQKAAAAEGVDVTDHAAWDAWLGNADAMSCADRLDERRALN